MRKIYKYSVSTPMIWSSVDHGTVMAHDDEQARQLASEELKYHFDNMNALLDGKYDINCDPSEMNLKEIDQDTREHYILRLVSEIFKPQFTGEKPFTVFPINNLMDKAYVDANIARLFKSIYYTAKNLEHGHSLEGLLDELSENLNIDVERLEKAMGVRNLYARITTGKKDEIEKRFINLITKIGMDIPENWEDIVQFIYEDVCESADEKNWNDSDIVIGFRRWIESN